MVAVGCGAEDNIAQSIVALIAEQIFERKILVFSAEQPPHQTIDGIRAAHDLEGVHMQTSSFVFYINAADTEQMREVGQRDQRSHMVAGNLLMEFAGISCTVDWEHFLGFRRILFRNVAVVVNNILKIVFHYVTRFFPL